ncbi:MAG: hypothetical protein ACOYOV_08135 [Bacteroidales bacterium]
MKTQNYILKTEQTMKLLDAQEKLTAKPFFETRQMALIEARLQAKRPLFIWQVLLKPAFIVVLTGINVAVVFSYLQRVNAYTNSRNTALIALSDNIMRSSDYYSFIHN